MSASFIDRMKFWKPLYTTEDVEVKLATMLKNTFHREHVIDAMRSIDTFDAGAVDNPLMNHIHRVFADLVKKDRLSDTEIALRIRKALREQ